MAHWNRSAHSPVCDAASTAVPDGLRSRRSAPVSSVAAVLNFIAGLILLVLVLGWEPRINGDAHEYLLVQEAIANHGSPDIRLADAQHVKELYRDHPAAEVFVPEFAESEKNIREIRDSYHGVYRASSGRYYSFHFWFYALLSTPAKLALRLAGADELKAYQLLNALLLIFATTYLLLWCRLPEWMRLALAAVLPFTGMLYYLRWPSPEIFSATGLLLCCVFFLERRYGLSIGAAVLASFQNQPIALIVPMILICSVYSVYVRERSWKALIGDGVAAACCLIPSAFYWIVFGTPSLIASLGLTDPKLVSLHRLHSFVFDLNQGLVVGMPAIVAMALFFVMCRVVGLLWPVRESWRTVLRQAFRREDILLIGSLPIMAGVTVIVNWSSGYAVFERYALWCGMPVLVWVVCQVERFTLHGMRTVVMASIVLVQLFSNFYFDGFGGYLSPYTHKPYVEWLFNVNPRLYDPEPEIFLERTLLREDVLYPRLMPVAYTGRDGAFRKILTERSVASDLVPRLCGVGRRLIDLDRNVSVTPDDVSYTWGQWGYLSGRFLCETNEPASSKSFATQVGAAEPGGSLLSNGKAGALQLGPYVSLPKGHYVVIWNLELVQAPASSSAPAIVEVTAWDTSVVVARKPLTIGELRSRAVSLEFSLDRDAQRVEYRILVSEGVVLRLHNIQRKVSRG
ncbi:MAG: hypothetical protein M1541_15235 [Acidobacteria bacterium]|nr:hypothetical protein [Acidobacteriota bacterium]